MAKMLLELDVDNIEACGSIASTLYILISNAHGYTAANEIFSQQPLNRRQIAELKNYRLLHTALRRLRDGPPFLERAPLSRHALLGAAHASVFKEEREQLKADVTGTWSRSVEQVAAELAEENKSLPPELRYGPTGTTSPTTMAKQIRRLIKNSSRK
jgi:hypothetical protein